MSIIYECIVHPGKLRIDPALQAMLRQAPAGPVIEWDHETWVTTEPVALHRDSTAPGLITCGVVLVNDPALLLVYEDRVYDAPPGTVFRFDARRLHGALDYKRRPPGHFAFLAWDIPPDTGVVETIMDMQRALQRKGEGLHPLDCGCCGCRGEISPRPAFAAPAPRP